MRMYLFLKKILDFCRWYLYGRKILLVNQGWQNQLQKSYRQVGCKSIVKITTHSTPSLPSRTQQRKENLNNYEECI
jgi:hypothetical protein